MWNRFQIRNILFFVIFGMLLFGCVPESRKADVVYGPAIPSAPLVPVPVLEERIAALSRILEEGSLNEADQKMARDLRAIYEKIRKDSLAQPPRYDYPEITRRLFSELNRLEESYYSSKEPVDRTAAETINRFSSARKKILDSYLYGDYQGVIDECLRLESSLGPNAVNPEIGLVFALSLAKKGMTQEAIRVGEKIAHELEGKPDLLFLLARITEWHAMLGQKEKALQTYEKLQDNLDGKEALFRSTQKNMAPGEVTPEPSPGASFASPAGTVPEVSETESLESVLKKTDVLIRDHRFDDAKLLLVKYRITLPEGSDMEAVDRALQRVDAAEQEYMNGELSQKRRQAETVAMAKKLIEEERFEEAIQEIEAFEKDQPGDTEIQSIKEIATEKLINQERNRAARLFLMARNASDPAKKEELLLSSYNKLKALIDKYPSSNLNNKLNDNIIKVREELLKLGVNPG